MWNTNGKGHSPEETHKSGTNNLVEDFTYCLHLSYNINTPSNIKIIVDSKNIMIFKFYSDLSSTLSENV